MESLKPSRISGSQLSVPGINFMSPTHNGKLHYFTGINWEHIYKHKGMQMVGNKICVCYTYSLTSGFCEAQ